MARRGRPQQRGRWADQITPLIPDDQALGPKHIAELAREAGLHHRQAATAIAVIKEGRPDVPLISSSDGVQFSNDPGLIRKEQRWVNRGIQTRMRRFFLGTLLPYLDLKAPSSPYLVRHVSRSLERLMEDVAEIVEIDEGDDIASRVVVGT